MNIVSFPTACLALSILIMAPAELALARSDGGEAGAIQLTASQKSQQDFEIRKELTEAKIIGDSAVKSMREFLVYRITSENDNLKSLQERKADETFYSDKFPAERNPITFVNSILLDIAIALRERRLQAYKNLLSVNLKAKD